jgi:hypothetical protein
MTSTRERQSAKALIVASEHIVVGEQVVRQQHRAAAGACSRHHEVDVRAGRAILRVPVERDASCR